MQEEPSPEDRLLGALLVGLVHWPAAVEAAVVALQPRHFGTEANRMVFKAIAALRRAGTAVDLATVYERLIWEGRTVEAGAPLRLADLWLRACSPADVPELAEALIREDRAEPPPRVFTREPEPVFRPSAMDISFDFGANAEPGAGE